MVGMCADNDSIAADAGDCIPGRHYGHIGVDAGIQCVVVYCYAQKNTG